MQNLRTGWRCLLCVIILVLLYAAMSGPADAAVVRPVDDFNDADSSLNLLGFRSFSKQQSAVSNDVFSATEEHLYTYNEPVWMNYTETNRALKISYNYNASNSSYEYGTGLWDGSDTGMCLDVTGYGYLSFRVKGASGDEHFYIRLLSGEPVNIEPDPPHSSQYLDISTSWSQVNIPLSAFDGLDKTKMKSIVFIFRRCEGHSSEGTVFIDNISFSNGYDAKPESRGPVRIDRTSGRLFVEKEPYYVKGVGYQPTPIGMHYTYPDDTRIYDRDFALLKEMGCNTVRTWGWNDGKVYSNFMAKAEEYGLKVIAGFWMPPAINYSQPWDSPELKSVENMFREFVNNYKGYNALLVWAVGNECNFSQTPYTVADFYGYANNLAKIAYELEKERYHPVIIVNGKLHNIGRFEKNADDMQLDYIDAWGTNLYAKNYLAVPWFSRYYDEKGWVPDPQNIFDVYAAKSTKPLIITEYGSEAFHTTDKKRAVQGYEDQEAQAAWVMRNTTDIMSAQGQCIGGCVMTYSDEWCKDPAGSPYTHDKGPATEWPLPDGYANEEWWGIVSVSDNGEDIDTVAPREVYHVLKDLFRR